MLIIQLESLTNKPIINFIHPNVFVERLNICIMINPLRGADREKIAGWVSENMRTSEDDSWRGQVLNLNELISHFFSRERGIVNQSSWYKSSYVKPDSLRAPDTEEK